MIHNFFENALTGFIKDIYCNIKPYEDVIDQTFPVFIMNTGDEAYLSNMHSESNKDKKKLYQRVPRMVINPSSMDISSDQLSNPNVQGKFVDINEGEFKSQKVSSFRRIPIQSLMSTKVYFSNIFQYFQFIEILMMTTYRVNTYNFEYSGKLHTASYTFTDSIDGVPNLNMGLDDERRGRELDLNFTLNLQYPAFDYYNSRTMMDASNTIQVFKHWTHTQNTKNELTTVPQNQETEANGGDDVSSR